MIDTLSHRLQEALGRDFRIDEEMGSGSNRVFAAVEVELDRPVMITVLPSWKGTGVSGERLRESIRVASGLEHPRIVPVIDAGRASDLVYTVMPFVSGESLRARLDREVRLPVGDVIGILRDVADALAYAHQRGVQHHNLTADSVLLTEGHAVVTGLGVAQALDSRADHGADIGAVGTVARDMLAGEVAPALERIVMRCLASDARERFRSMAELRDQLARLDRRT